MERMSIAAREALSRARDEAVRWNHDHTGPEHVLLALAWPNPPILAALGLTCDSICAAVEAVAPRLPGPPIEVPQHPRVKATIDRAIAEARRLGDEELGLEHLLLGMLAETDSPAAKALIKLGINAGRLQPLFGSRLAPRPPVIPTTLPAEFAPLDEVIAEIGEATITAAGSQDHERAAWLRDLEAKLRIVRKRLVV